MTAPYAQEIAANLARAEESVQAAQVLMAAGYGDFATSRAYYAAFYAATAALLAEEREFSKHSGVIAAVHQYLCKLASWIGNVDAISIGFSCCAILATMEKHAMFPRTKQRKRL